MVDLGKCGTGMGLGSFGDGELVSWTMKFEFGISCTVALSLRIGQRIGRDGR